MTESNNKTFAVLSAEVAIETLYLQKIIVFNTIKQSISKRRDEYLLLTIVLVPIYGARLLRKCCNSLPGQLQIFVISHPGYYT